jgi:putative ABC transport system substrate-binding protein
MGTDRALCPKNDFSIQRQKKPAPPASKPRGCERMRSWRVLMGEAGFVEKQNLLIEYRWADFRYDRLPALADDLVARRVDVIFATGSVVSALAAKAATTTYPSMQLL